MLTRQQEAVLTRVAGLPLGVLTPHLRIGLHLEKGFQGAVTLKCGHEGGPGSNPPGGLMREGWKMTCREALQGQGRGPASQGDQPREEPARSPRVSDCSPQHWKRFCCCSRCVCRARSGQEPGRGRSLVGAAALLTDTPTHC